MRQASFETGRRYANGTVLLEPGHRKARPGQQLSAFERLLLLGAVPVNHGHRNRDRRRYTAA